MDHAEQAADRHAFDRLFSQAEDGIRDLTVTGVQTCALPILTTTPRPPSPVSMERWRGPPSVGRWSKNWSRWGGDETRLIWTMRAGCCAWERGAATTNAPSKIKNLTGTSSDLRPRAGRLRPIARVNPHCGIVRRVAAVRHGRGLRPGFGPRGHGLERRRPGAGREPDADRARQADEACMSHRSHLAFTEQAANRGQSPRKSTRLNSSHSQISYAVFCLKKKKNQVLMGQ